jgi:hypothetical protein
LWDGHPCPSLHKIHNAKIYFVIGDSAPYGIYIPVIEWLGLLACSAGFKSFEFKKFATVTLNGKIVSIKFLFVRVIYGLMGN